MGQRVELLEVEDSLNTALRTKSLGSSGVIVVVANDDEDPQLVSVVTQGTDVDAVRKHMSETLPAAWVPVSFHEILAFPLLPSGKVDRSQLRDYAAELRTQSRQGVVDSLGRLRQMGKDMAYCQIIVQSMMGIGMVHIVGSHWYSHAWGFSRVPLPFGTVSILVARAAHFELTHWLDIFVAAAGVAESVRLGGAAPRFGLQDLYILVLTCTFHWLWGPVFVYAAWLLNVGGTIMSSGSGVLWFLQALLLFKLVLVLLHPLLRLCSWEETSPWKSPLRSVIIGCAQALAIYSFFWFELFFVSATRASDHVNLDRVNLVLGRLELLTPGLKWSCARLFRRLEWSPWYVLSYWAGPPALRWLAGVTPGRLQSRVAWHVIAFTLWVAMLRCGQPTFLGTWLVPRSSFSPLWPKPAVPEISVDFLLAWLRDISLRALTLMALVLALAPTPGLFAYLGQSALSGYLCHYSFMKLFVVFGVVVFGCTLFPSTVALLEVASSYGNLGIGLALYVPIVVFVVCIAAPLNYVLARFHEIVDGTAGAILSVTRTAWALVMRLAPVGTQ